MNNQIQNDEPFDRRTSRRKHRADRREARAQSASGWIIGVILVALGGLFLMQNMGAYKFPINNWWALFILIPVFGFFERALHYYRKAGNQWTSQVGSCVLLGVTLGLATLGFLFNIGWTYFGPALIILPGLGILLNSMIGKKE